jgi:hypothetical protein
MADRDAGSAHLICLHASGLIANMGRCRGRPHFRAVHGDQLGYGSDRPDQANRDNDGDSDQCTHFASPLRRVELAEGSHIFRRPNVRQLTLREGR